MNRTGIETLEKRLKATRAERAAEEERRRNITFQLSKTDQRIEFLHHVEADLTEALEEARAWEIDAPGDPLASPCHSCGAKAGEPCRSPSGDEVDTIHATRGAPS